MSQNRWRWLWVVVAVAAVVALLPLGVQAARQLVVIKDPETSSKARVTNGRLRVGDQSGPLTVDGAITPETETQILSSATSAPLSLSGNVFPFDAPAYGQLRVSIRNSSSTVSVNWLIQQTWPEVFTIDSGTVAADSSHSEMIPLPGREMRLVLTPSDETTDVNYLIVGR